MSARRYLAQGLALAALVTLAGFAPRLVDDGTLRLVAEMLLAVCMVQMWNLLAGYTGLLSLGHQLFIGIGAYVLFLGTQRWGVSPYWMLPVAGGAGALVAAVLAPALFRLRDAYFAIGLWVFSEIVYLLVSKTPAFGSNGGIGLDLSALQEVESFQAMSFWLACAIGLGAWIGIFALVRSRLGLAMLAVRENELAARSAGVNVWRVRFPAFVVSGFGCAIAGAAYFMGGMFVTPDSAFDINWAVMMMFATLIGGVGSLEGPVIGVAVWFALRETLTTWLHLPGGWYLMAMGAVAMVASLVAPRGLWGILQRRFGWEGLAVCRRPPAMPR
jgi:branched-chain amino acid transport system permease protein